MNAYALALTLPEDMPSFLALLGQLLCLKLHETEVKLGRIQPLDVRDLLRRLARARPILLGRSASPCLFIYLSRNDSHSCARCAKAHLHMFAGNNPGEAPVKICCVNPLGCRCVVIPIIGRWPAAERLRARLSTERGYLQLSQQDLHALVHQGGDMCEQDQLARRLLRAMLGDETDPHDARETYWQVIADTANTSNVLLQGAAYIRLAELLERSGEFTEALNVTRSFLRAFTEKDRLRVLDKPQYDRMRALRTRLLRRFLIPPSASVSCS